MTNAAGLSHHASIQRGRRLEYFTIGYNSLEGLVSIAAGLIAGNLVAEELEWKREELEWKKPQRRRLDRVQELAKFNQLVQRDKASAFIGTTYSFVLLATLSIIFFQAQQSPKPPRLQD